MLFRNALLIVFLSFSTLLSAQENFSVEVSGGPALVNDDVTEDIELNTGIALEGLLHYEIYRDLGVYAGWGWTRFRSEEVSIPDVPLTLGKVDFKEVGYRLGISYDNLIGGSRFGYFIRAGALYTQIRAESLETELTGESDWDQDWQAAIGFIAQLTPYIELRPGFRYQVLEREIEYSGLLKPTDSELTYSAVTLSAVVNLGILD